MPLNKNLFNLSFIHHNEGDIIVCGWRKPGSGRFRTFLCYISFFFLNPQSPFRILDRDIVVDERSIRERGRAEWSMRMGDWSVFCHPLKFFFSLFFSFFFPVSIKQFSISADFNPLNIFYCYFIALKLKREGGFEGLLPQ